ncbi:MAG: hypothetical protein R2828_21540 [Saprospiraceae bacterium]
MKTLILILSLFPTAPLPSKTTLQTTINSLYQTQTTTQLLEFQSFKKAEWPKYLPTIE